MPAERLNNKKKGYSPWCSMTIMHLERLGMKNVELAAICRVDQAIISQQLSGDRLPRIDLAEQFAEAFGLLGSEREAYLMEAHLAHAPIEVRSYVNKLRRQVTDLTVQVATGKPRQPAAQSE